MTLAPLWASCCSNVSPRAVNPPCSSQTQHSRFKKHTTHRHQKCPVVQVPFAVRFAPLREDSQGCEYDQACEYVPGIVVGYYSAGEGLHDVEDHAESSTNNCKCVGNRAARLSSPSLVAVPHSDRPSFSWASAPSRMISYSTSPSSLISETSMHSIWCAIQHCALHLLILVYRLAKP